MFDAQMPLGHATPEGAGYRVRIEWVAAALLWVIPLLALLTCPYDIHAGERCSAFSHALRLLSAFMLMPAWWLLEALPYPYAGASTDLGCLLFIVANVAWMGVLTALVIAPPALVRRRRAQARDSSGFNRR